MADLLGEVDTNIPSRMPAISVKTIKSESRRKVRVLSPPVSERTKAQAPKNDRDVGAGHLLSTPPLELAYEDDNDFSLGNDDDQILISDPMPSSPIANAVERKNNISLKVEEEEDDIMEISQAVGDHNVKTTSVNISGSRPVPKVLKKPSYPTPESSSPILPPADAVNASTWNDVTSKLNVLSSPVSQLSTPGKVDLQNATEEDGSVNIFWTDYTEVNGSLCLFGKVKDKSNGSYVSAFVKIDNILRKLFFLPREYKQSESPSTHT